MESVELFQKGGPVMYLLLLCSITVAVIMIDRILFYRRARQGLTAFTEKLPDMLDGTPWEKAAETLRAERNAAAFVATAGAAAAAAGRDPQLALDTAYTTAAAELRARLNYLSMIITLAPLLGLLGTISGMISSFNIFSLQTGQPLAITGGIGEALIATATGLCVAIFALVVHTYFAQKMDEVLTLTEKAEAAVQSELRKRG